MEWAIIMKFDRFENVNCVVVGCSFTTVEVNY
jgi:hypothetical protein